MNLTKIRQKAEQNAKSRVCWVLCAKMQVLADLLLLSDRHYARNDKKYQSSLCANMAYIFENYTSVETFWCKNWIHTCTILGDSHSQLL